MVDISLQPFGTNGLLQATESSSSPLRIPTQKEVGRAALALRQVTMPTRGTG